jgi:bifunctional N-acetylglucosamine-1-phosphate-uridyltransferase/glucosamine-1-phosphate-acetyltransferase GlmU-like protein
VNIRNICITLTLIAHTAFATAPIDNVQAVLLAAGKSKRFKNSTSKVLAPLQYKPLIVHALEPLQDLQIPIILVVGHQRDLVRQAVEDAGIKSVQYAVQEELLGTGHAVLCAQPYWSKKHILITYGDMPLINADIISNLYQTHINQDADLTLIVAANVEPSCTYGRIVKNGNDIRIVEKKHFTLDINEYPLVNAGIYLVKREVLEMCLAEIKQNEVTQEYYFTDILEIANKKNLRIATLEVPFNAVRGINTQEEYLEVINLLETSGS